MRISDWSSDVCSSDLFGYCGLERVHRFWRPGQEFCDIRVQPHWCCPRRSGAYPCGAFAYLELRAAGRSGQGACPLLVRIRRGFVRSEEHTSELQSLMRISYAVFCLKKKKQTKTKNLHLQRDVT